MSRVLTFSRTFPAYHPKAGQPTWFVEKFWKSLYDQDYNYFLDEMLTYEPIYQKAFPVEFRSDAENIHNHTGKHHTIRAGHRWKKGHYFSPRVWSGKPYHSPQITIGPDTLITDTFDIKIEGYTMKNVNVGDSYIFITIGSHFKCSIPQEPKSDLPALLAKNDGLETQDLIDWFTLSKEFKKTGLFGGQIICWNENIKY